MKVKFNFRPQLRLSPDERVMANVRREIQMANERKFPTLPQSQLTRDEFQFPRGNTEEKASRDSGNCKGD